MIIHHPTSQTPTQTNFLYCFQHRTSYSQEGENMTIWAMKWNIFSHTDYPIWEIIQNRNGPISITTNTQGQIKILPPRTTEEILARERERKARTTLLIALLEDHLAKFHKMTGAKRCGEANQIIDLGK
ncbi:hypothetical protein Tco_0317515 [Tanacetum coccineum]